MKKLIFLLTIALCFSACSKAEETISQSSVVGEEAKAQGGNLTKCSMGTSEGRYFIGYANNKIMLGYIDFATATEVALCSAPSCAHNAEGCTALLEEKRRANYLHTIGEDKLIMATYGNLLTDPYMLEIMDKNGSNRKELYVGKSGEGYFVPLASDEENVYFGVEKTQGEKTELFIYSVPFTGDEAKPVYEIQSRSAAVIGAWGRELYFNESDWSEMDNIPRPLPPENATKEEIQKLYEEYDALITGKHYVYKVNIDTGETVKLLDWTSKAGSSGKIILMLEDTIYLCDNEIFAVIKADGTRQEISINWPSPLKEKEHVSTVDAVIDGKAIVCVYNNTQGSVARYYIDLASGDASLMNLTYIANGRETPVTVGGVSPESLLIQYDCRVEDVVDITPDGTPVSIFKVTNSYAMISYDDFLQSKPNYKQINTVFAMDIYGY